MRAIEAEARRPIRPLPPLLVNQIAAGEVVERPASVVKELVENAIDAGAGRVGVEIEAGGIELVRVTDDGCGVALAEAAMMLAPHATSKIAGAEDLDAIGTMGFRGEALASIASVSRMGVRSRARGEASAWSVESEGGEAGEPRPDAGPVGTAVTVRNLFYNTPARRKFLRTAATEQQRCLETLRDLALGRPDIAFTAVADGRTVVDLPARDNPRDRALDVMGRELEPQLVEVSADGFDGAGEVSLWGLVGLPAIARATNKAQKIFINGRCVRDRTIQHALQEAYRGLMPHDRKPTAVLLIEMSPALVDVNVHPAKAEVRFRDSSLVHSAVLRAVREALAREDLTPTFGGGGRVGATEILPGDGPTARTVGSAASAFVDYFRRPAATAGGGRFDYETLRRAVEAERAAESAAAGAEEVRPAEVEREKEGLGLAPAAQSPRVLQVRNSFVVTQDEQGLLIIDQHALHERVMFEGIMERLRRQGTLESQRLLTPITLGATAGQMEALGALGPVLERLGLEAAPIGPGTVAVHAFPSLLLSRGVEPGGFVAELMERAEAERMEGPTAEEAALHRVVDMMACKAAIKAGDSLSGAELEALLALRDEVERSSACPHGRPTSIRVTLRELERRFGRG